jgi:TolA-binding protein
MPIDLIQIIAPLAIGLGGTAVTEALRARRRVRQTAVEDAGETTRHRDELHTQLSAPIITQLTEQLGSMQTRIDELQRQQAAEATECARRVATLEAHLEHTRTDLGRAEARIRHLEDTRG